DPVVIVKYKGLLAVRMNARDAFAAKVHDKGVDEFDPVLIKRSWYLVGVVVEARIDEVLRAGSVALDLLKLANGLSAHGKFIGTPVIDQEALVFAISPEPPEIVEHGGQTHDFGVGVRIEPLLQIVEDLFPCFR